MRYQRIIEILDLKEKEKEIEFKQIGSKIVTNQTNLKFIYEKIIENKSFKLVYRGSDHGMNPYEFHRSCDGIPNTVTIILSKDKRIFGGFSQIKWSS